MLPVNTNTHSSIQIALSLFSSIPCKLNSWEIPKYLSSIKKQRKMIDLHENNSCLNIAILWRFSKLQWGASIRDAQNVTSLSFSPNTFPRVPCSLKPKLGRSIGYLKGPSDDLPGWGQSLGMPGQQSGFSLPLTHPVSHSAPIIPFQLPQRKLF